MTMNIFINTDERLVEKATAVLAERKRLGLEGMIGGLEAVIINAEPDLLGLAVQGFLDTTGYVFAEAFSDAEATTFVLNCPGSADLLIRSRQGPGNPFAAANDFPIGRRLPNTRLETFVFKARNLSAFVEIQSGRGVRFMTPQPLQGEGWKFIQTFPSRYTGNSIGFVEWTGATRQWRTSGAVSLERDRRLVKPERPFLSNIGRLDHCATRVRAEERDDAILEFIALTDYRFQFAIHVESLNSITNVARLGPADFAMVFTSGISPFVDEETSGPTEKFAHSYGPRVHHLAFETREIEAVVDGLATCGLRYLDSLVGSPEEGLKQIFTVSNRHTFLVNEYIQRFGDFDGFFTRSNVTRLTKATANQD